MRSPPDAVSAAGLGTVARPRGSWGRGRRRDPAPLREGDCHANRTVRDSVKATDWQPHTVRGFFAGALKKRLGIEVTSEKTEDGKRVYRIAS